MNMDEWIEPHCKKYRPIFETMTKVNIGIYTVRVWRDTNRFQFGDTDLFDELTISRAFGLSDIFEHAKSIEGVSALEITNASGQGIVWHREWP